MTGVERWGASPRRLKPDGLEVHEVVANRSRRLDPDSIFAGLAEFNAPQVELLVFVPVAGVFNGSGKLLWADCDAVLPARLVAAGGVTEKHVITSRPVDPEPPGSAVARRRPLRDVELAHPCPPG